MRVWWPEMTPWSVPSPSLHAVASKVKIFSFPNILTCPTDPDLDGYLSLNSLRVSCLGWSLTPPTVWLGSGGLPAFLIGANVSPYHTLNIQSFPCWNNIIELLKPSFICKTKLCHVASNPDSRLANSRRHWNLSQVHNSKRIFFA